LVFPEQHDLLLAIDEARFVPSLDLLALDEDW
jgi:hypothetical protein